MSTLDTDAINRALEQLEGWTLDGDALRRDFSFPGFRDAIAFIDRVADLADEANHHPEIRNVYTSVTLVLSSHDVGGVTQRDLDLAAAVDRVAGGPE